MTRSTNAIESPFFARPTARLACSRGLGLLALLTALSGSARVLAEPADPSRSLAEALFRDARTLMQKNQYAEACAKFAESQRLDPAGGTLLNLAICHEKEGKLATAWGELRDALTQARAQSRTERIEIAEQHLASIEPIMPRLSVLAAGDRAAGGLSLTIDGVPLGKAAWGTSLPLDPGAHVVRASAPGRGEWESRVELKAGDSKSIEVPELGAADGEDSPGGALRGSSGDAAAGRRQRIAGYIAGGLGIAAAAVGGYYGLQAFAAHRKSNDLCPSNDTCTDDGARFESDARRDAWISDIGIGLGVAGVGIGTYLLLTLPGASKKTGNDRAPAVAITVNAGPHENRLVVYGAF